jgi:hypothetical protein
VFVFLSFTNNIFSAAQKVVRTLMLMIVLFEHVIINSVFDDLFNLVLCFVAHPQMGGSRAISYCTYEFGSTFGLRGSNLVEVGLFFVAEGRAC